MHFGGSTQRLTEKVETGLLEVIAQIACCTADRAGEEIVPHFVQIGFGKPRVELLEEIELLHIPLFEGGELTIDEVSSPIKALVLIRKLLHCHLIVVTMGIA